jgi:hypothetical protein
METHYVAYGLHITSSFDLPSAEPAKSVPQGLPMMALAICEPAEIERRWSGGCGAPEWTGRLGDGLDLKIDRGVADDQLFSYGERARFRLSADMRSLQCAPEHAGLDWQRVLISKVLPAISVMRGYEGLHAAAVQSEFGVVAIMAASGSGKSTLATELLARGWPLFADDVLILDNGSGTLLAYPGTPHMNLAEDSVSAVAPSTFGQTLGVMAGERWLTAASTSSEPCPVRMLCLLERADGLELGSEPLPASPLPLSPYMLGLASGAARQRSRFELYADLMQSASLVRITAGLQHPPAELADLVEHALHEQAGLTAREPR